MFHLAGNHKLGQTVGHVADIKDTLGGIGNVDVGDVFGAVHTHWLLLSININISKTYFNAL